MAAMHDGKLSTPCGWEPIEIGAAKRRRLPVVPLAPSFRAKDIGLVFDRSVWFETRMAPRWRVAMRLIYQRGQPVIAELRVFPDEPGQKHPPGRWSGEYGAPVPVPHGGVTARVLRMIRTQAFRKDLLKIRARWANELREEPFSSLFPLTPEPLSRVGRKGRSDSELARIAKTYEHAYVTNRPLLPAVVKTHRLTYSQARDAVRRARVRGLLTPASKQGKSGGLLTPLAKKLLKEKHNTGGRRR